MHGRASSLPTSLTWLPLSTLLDTMIPFKTAMLLWGAADAVLLGGSCMFAVRPMIKRVRAGARARARAR